MNCTSNWLSVCNLFFGGMAAGCLAFELLVIVPAMSLKRVSLQMSALLHHQLLGKGNLPARMLPPSALIGGVCGIVLVATKDHQTSTFTTLYDIGIVLMVTMGVSTGLWSQPINMKIARYPEGSFDSEESVPADYRAFRKRWDRLMVFRTTIGVTAFALWLIATLQHA